MTRDSENVSDKPTKARVTLEGISSCLYKIRHGLALSGAWSDRDLAKLEVLNEINDYLGESRLSLPSAPDVGKGAGCAPTAEESVWPATGTYNCPICGRDTPHSHTTCTEVVAPQVEPECGCGMLRGTHLIEPAELCYTKNQPEVGESQPVAPVEKKWICFFCEFETTDPKAAAAHFGDRDDAEEFKPVCKWWARLTEDERVETLQDTLQQLNERQDELDAAESKKVELETALRQQNEVIVQIESLVEFYSKREMESPSNSQEAVRDAAERLSSFRKAAVIAKELLGETKA